MHASLVTQNCVSYFWFQANKASGTSQGSYDFGYAFGLDSAFAGLASFVAAGLSSLPPAGFASLPA